MFENHDIPKELKGNKLKKKLPEYLRKHPDKQYQINVKNIPSKTDCIKILDETLKSISLDALGRDDAFILNIEN